MTGLLRYQDAALPVLNSRASYIFDPSCCHQRIAKTIQVISIEPIGGSDNYVHKSASCDIGSIALSAGMGSAFRFSVDDHDTATLMLSTGGSAQVRIGNSTYISDPQSPAVYLAGERYSCQIRQANGIELRLDRQKLAQRALVMAEQVGRDSLDCCRLYQPWQVRSDNHLSMGLVAMLSRTLTYLDLTTLELSGDTLARIETLIYQQIAAMLYPELLSPT
jgi:hypothetical protein